MSEPAIAMYELCLVGSVGGGCGRNCIRQIVEIGAWRDRPKDFSRFCINTRSRYLGWGSGSDGDHPVKMVGNLVRIYSLGLFGGGFGGCGF